MKFDSYKEITQTADIHIAILKKINSIGEDLKGDETLSGNLSKQISVGGKPFDMAKHLTTLEAQSDSWDLMTNQIEDKSAVSDAKKVEIIQLTKDIMSKDPTYNLAHFTEAYQAMTNDLVDRKVPLDPKPAPQIGAGLIKTLTQPVSSGPAMKFRPN